jgi:hypothetical protein
MTELGGTDFAGVACILLGAAVNILHWQSQWHTSIVKAVAHFNCKGSGTLQL